jgi:uncharacterized protein
MGFSLIPREMRFFDLFDEVTAHLVASARQFAEMLKAFDRLEQRARAIQQQEEACDELVAKLVEALDVSFITPFDREDIHTLACSLDDVMDNIEHAAHRFAGYRIEQPTATANDLVRIIFDCCTHLESALRLCRDLKKAAQIQAEVRAIYRLEKEADHLYRRADADLLNGPATDVLAVIKWRELYGWLERTVDSCQAVADAISEIVIKGT